MIIGIGLIVAIIMGILGRYVAKEKNRSGAEGFWIGFLFSILGVIIVALLPTKEKKEEVKESETQGEIGLTLDEYNKRNQAKSQIQRRYST